MPYKFKNFVQPYIDPLQAQSAQILNKRFVDYFSADTELDKYLSDLQSATFDADQAQANSMRTKYRASIDQRVEQGDYENLGGSIIMDARNFIKDYTPLEKNYTAQAEFQTSLQKQVADGTIMPETAALAMQRDIYNYNQDALAKGIHQYNPSTVSEDIPNLVKYFEDNYLKGYIKRNYEEDTTYFTEDGVYKVKKKDGVKDFIPQKDIQLMYNNMLADSKVQSYLSQYSDLRTFDLDPQTLEGNRQETVGALTNAFMQMQDKYSTMRPTGERDKLMRQMQETKKTLDAITNATPEEYKTLIKQGLIEEVLDPAEKTIIAKYAGERNVKKLVEQSYSKLYLKKVEHQYALDRAHQKYLYDISLKRIDAERDRLEEEAQDNEELQEYLDVIARSGQDSEEATSFLQTTPGPNLTSEDQLDLMFSEGYSNLTETVAQFDQEFGSTSEIEGTVYTADGKLIGDSTENLPDGSYLVDTGNNNVETLVIANGKPLGSKFSSQYDLPIADPAYDSMEEVVRTANKQLEAVMSVDASTVESPLKQAKLAELQKTAASQYNDLVISGAVNKELSAMEAQADEEFLLRNERIQDFVEMGFWGHQGVLYDRGPGAKATKEDIKLAMSSGLLGSGNNLDIYVVNDAEVSKISPNGEVVKDLSVTDIPQFTEDETFKPSDDLAMSEVVIPGIRSITTGEDNMLKAQKQTIHKATDLTEAFVSLYSELHKGDFYGEVMYSPKAVRQAYNVEARGALEGHEEQVKERTQKLQQEFITDFYTKGTNLGGIEGMVPASTPEGGKKEALSNTKAYSAYLKAPLPSQKVYELFDPELDSDIQEYQLFLEDGQFNVNLVDDDGKKLPGLSLGDIFGVNNETGKLDAFMVPGSLRSEVQIPPINKRGISLVYQQKGTDKAAGAAKRIFIPYENLPATLPQIKERLYNEGLQYVAQKWNQSMMTGRDADLLLNPILAGRPIDFETEDGNHIFAGKVRFSPMKGEVSYLDINGNPIPGSEKTYNDWAASLPKNTLNIIDQFFNK